MLKLDEKINVVVPVYNDDDKRISLGMKQLTEHPWNSLDEDLDITLNESGGAVISHALRLTYDSLSVTSVTATQSRAIVLGDS